MKIKLIDSCMGSHKTTMMLGCKDRGIRGKIESLCEEYDQMMYVSPNLTEVGGLKDGNTYLEGRVQKNLPHLNFRYPVPKNGSKSNHIRELLVGCENVSATHSLFNGLCLSDIQLIKENKNCLIIDESVNALDIYNSVSETEIKLKIKAKQLLVDKETCRVSWNDVDYPIPESDIESWEFSELYRLTETGYIYFINKKILIWQFSPEVLQSFDQVWVMTYLFEGTIMKSWCEMNGIEVENCTHELNLPKTERELIESYRGLIEIIEPNSLAFSKVGKLSLSQAWWQKADKNKVKEVRSVAESVVNNYFKGISYKDMLVTCPKANWGTKDQEATRPTMKGKRYTKATWLSVQTRATNDYADAKAVMYMLNKYPNIYVDRFVIMSGYEIDKDMYALSELLQWLWRGCIRNGEPMKVYIANKRMRDLFKRWLDGDFIKD